MKIIYGVNNFFIDFMFFPIYRSFKPMEIIMNYSQFLKEKSQVILPTGIKDIPQLNNHLFDYQHDIVTWALKRGSAALFAGTGLGKSLMELSWADALIKSQGIKVIIFTPLAVAAQMEREANKFGIDAKHVQKQTNDNIQITNYQKIDHFDLSQFDGVVLDESSILKNYTGHFRTRLINECKKIKFKLAATATPSPNDYMELGNHAEFCGIMSYTDMLSTFFTHDGSSTQNWRLKGHAESKFWEWMATWSVMLQSPADLGYDGSKHILPELHQYQHIVDVEYESNIETGMLFPMHAQTMSERLKARRATIDERVNFAAKLINKDNQIWVIWCNLNDESSMLANLIPDAVEVRGSDSDEKKEKILEQFANNEIRVLITKPSICGFGMNWQHCNHTCFVGLNDSFEQIYQAIRRFWRFGQTKEVHAHFISSEIEGNVLANIKRKETQAEHMMNQMVKHTSSISSENIKGLTRDTASYLNNEKMEIPKWI